MQITVVRHGESIGNTKKGFISGRVDRDGLSKKGKIQIVRTAWELKAHQFDTVLVSPVTRTKETAQILNLYHHAPIQMVDWLTELHHGVFEGKFWWEMMDQVPKGWQYDKEAYDQAIPGGGESFQQLGERVWHGFKWLLSTFPEHANLLLVSHQATITAFRFCVEHGAAHQLHTKPEQNHFVSYMHTHSLKNGGILELKLDKQKFLSLVEHNDFSPVTVSPESASFYIQGVFNTHPPSELNQIPTSANDTVYHALADQPYLLKIYQDKEPLAVKKLIQLYHYLKTHTAIPAPEIIFEERSQVFFAGGVVIQDYQDGGELENCLRDCPDNINSLTEQIYQILNQIHQIPVDQVKKFWYTDDWKVPEVEYPSFVEYFQYQINQTLSMVEAMDDMDLRIKQTIQENLAKLLMYIQMPNFPVTPIHGDVSPHNFITTHVQGKCMIKRVLDFERANLGDPLWDLAYYFGWIQRTHPEAAVTWEKRVRLDLTLEKKSIFDQYVILFHAWTIRDQQNYQGVKKRELRANQSYNILKSLYSHQ